MATMTISNQKPQKPLLRYYGGKWLLAKWIIEHMPQHRIYVEPFGGAASVLLQKDVAFSEVYNDLDGDVVNLFRVLQNKSQYAELEHRLKYTLHSRVEFEDAYNPSRDPVDRAHKLIVRSWMGYSTGAHRRTGYRTNIKQVARSSTSTDWCNWVDTLELTVQRIRTVNIENRPAVDVIQGHDTGNTLFYVDPPYPFSTRSDKVYNHEMTDEQHADLAKVLHEVSGMVMISGYACKMYDDQLYADWHRLERKHYANGGRERLEVLWMNDACYNANAASGQMQLL